MAYTSMWSGYTLGIKDTSKEFYLLGHYRALLWVEYMAMLMGNLYELEGGHVLLCPSCYITFSKFIVNIY